MSLPKARTRGFTLLEALVALAVMAAGLAAIGQLGYGSLAAVRRTGVRLQLTAAAEAAMAALPDRGAPRDGTSSGAIFRESWRLATAPFPDAPAGGPIHSGWEPQILELKVSDPSGSVVTVDTVRLRRSGP